MIAFIRGKINTKGENTVVVEVGGFGVEIFVTPTTLQQLHMGSEAMLYTYLRMWDSGMELYGFRTQQEKEFFELLLSVSGVGPKVALNIMAVAPLENIAASIRDGDERVVSQAHKVGKKLASKVILELRDKVQVFASSSSATYQAAQSVVDALIVLGYSRAQAREAVSLANKPDAPIAEQVKAALQILAA